MSILKHLFKKPNFLEDIKQILDRSEFDWHINLYVDDQILFQIVPAKDYAHWGLKGTNLEGFLEIHFFNKNKTYTLQSEEAAKSLLAKGELNYIEEPKGIRNYYRILKKDSAIIENAIQEAIGSVYSNIDSKRISIKYDGY